MSKNAKPEGTKGTHKSAKKLACVLLLLLAAAYVMFSPRLYKDGLENYDYRSWLEHVREPSVGVIEVWHIVGIKPYVGSLGVWLSKRAQSYSSSYIGIHFDVRSMSAEEANAELERGLMPDVVSFSKGVFPASLLAPMGEETEELFSHSGCRGGCVFALPYCVSGKAIIYDPNRITETDAVERIDSAGTANEFKLGKTEICVCDIRETGDLTRALLTGDAPYFETVPLESGRDAVQFLGVTVSIDEVKLPYALGFVNYILSPASQKRLSDVGIIAADPSVLIEYEQDLVSSLAKLYDPEEIISPFTDEAG